MKRKINSGIIAIIVVLLLGMGYQYYNDQSNLDDYNGAFMSGNVLRYKKETNTIVFYRMIDLETKIPFDSIVNPGKEQWHAMIKRVSLGKNFSDEKYEHITRQLTSLGLYSGTGWLYEADFHHENDSNIFFTLLYKIFYFIAGIAIGLKFYKK